MFLQAVGASRPDLAPRRGIDVEIVHLVYNFVKLANDIACFSSAQFTLCLCVYGSDSAGFPLQSLK